AGKGVKRLDTLDRVTGKQVYGTDLKLPGMLTAAIKECPVQGGKIKSFDATKVANMPGVKKVVQVGDSGVAVVADTWWQAKTALDALPITWDEGENAKVSSASIAEWLKAGLDAPEAFVGNANGDAKDASAKAGKKVEAVYAYPYQNHVGMDPMNATALYTADKCKDPLTFQGLMPTGQEHAFGYSVPNLLIDHAMRNPHIKPGFWRGVNINQNCIFIECFMDELAQATGQDELEFRRKLMANHPK